MNIRHVTPILNVSNLQESFAWFGRLGWGRAWDWGDPPDFGSVGNGEFEIFLCQDGQGGRARPGTDPADTAAGGTWMTWWVGSPSEVDEVHAAAVREGLHVLNQPADYPWNVREFHLRHPDGHTFRVSAGLR